MGFHIYLAVLMGASLGTFNLFAEGEAPEPHGKVLEFAKGKVLSKDQISEQLEKFYIPEIKFQEISLEDAIERLAETVRERGSGAGKKVELGFDVVLQDEVGLEIITLECSNIPLKTALIYLCNLGGAKYQIYPGEIEIFSRARTGDSSIPSRVFDVPAALQTSNWLDTGEPESKKTAKRYFEVLGISFPAGTSIFYNEANSQLSVAQTHSKLKLIEKHLKLFEKGDEGEAETEDGR